jgi:hypothetical protein
MNTLPATFLKKTFAATALAASLFGLVAPTFAQSAPVNTTVNPSTDVVLTAIPPRTETISVQPGETYQKTIQLRNVSNQTQTIVTDVQDFIIGADGKTPLAIAANEAAPLRWSLASWLIVSPRQRQVGPNELVTYDVVIQVPKDALPGGHYAMILHHPSATNGKFAKGINEPTSASEISPKVGTLLYVKVAGNIHEEAYIRNFTAPQFVEYGPVSMQYSIENLSDIHITPQSSIVVKNMFGLPVQTIAVEALNVFPYASRTFTAQFDKIWGIGPYTAHLTVPFGDSGKMLTATVVFWMFPTRVVLAILVIVMTLIAVAIVIRRHLEHRNDAKSKKIEVLEDRIRELEEQTQRR